MVVDASFSGMHFVNQLLKVGYANSGFNDFNVFSATINPVWRTEITPSSWLKE